MLIKSSAYNGKLLVLHEISNIKSSSSYTALQKRIIETTIIQTKIIHIKLYFFILETQWLSYFSAKIATLKNMLLHV